MKTDGDIVVLNTAKSTQVLHPLVLEIDLRSIGREFHIDLHTHYKKLFFSPAVVSYGAPKSIPHYKEDELFYYITQFNPSLVKNLSIDQSGLLTYDVIAIPPNQQAVFEVVMVVKGTDYSKNSFLNAAQNKPLRFNRVPLLKTPSQCAFPENVN